MLDIGAGDGGFVAALRRSGFRAEGIDPRPLSRNGVRAGKVEDVALEPDTYDAVFLWHSLEHLEDPAATLRRIFPALVPGGRLVVSVPNRRSVQALIGGDRWFHQDVPRHVVHFTGEGLRLLLVRCGFGVRRVRPVVLEQGLLGMWQTLLNRLTSEPDVAFRALKRHLPHRSRSLLVRDLAITVAAGPLLLPAAAVAEVTAGAAARGGAIAADAYRPL